MLASLAGNISAWRLSRARPRSDQSPVETPTAKAAPSGDPRWDEHGFRAWATKHVSFIRKGDLQDRAQGTAGSKFTKISVDEAFKGASPGIAGKQVFAVLSLSLVHHEADEAAELEALLAVLNKESLGQPIAAADDLVCWPRFCIDGDNVDARAELYRLFTFYRVQTVILPGATREPSIFDHLETMAYLALTAFCQRITNASDTAVKAGLDLARLIDLPNTLDGLEVANGAEFDRVASMMGSVVKALREVHKDDVGFRILCEEAQLQWLHVGYVKQLAARQGCTSADGKCPGPCPRKQEVPPRDDCRVIGRPPEGCRMYVMSHGWDSMCHISPNGRKLQLLADALKKMGARDRDVVFIDVIKPSHEPGARSSRSPGLFLLSLSRIAPVIFLILSSSQAFHSGCPLMACPNYTARTTSSPRRSSKELAMNTAASHLRSGR